MGRRNHRPAAGRVGSTRIPILVAAIAILLLGCSSAPDSVEERKQQCASDVPRGYWVSVSHGLLLMHYARTDELITLGSMEEWLERDAGLRGIFLNHGKDAFSETVLGDEESVEDSRYVALTAGQKLAVAIGWFDVANSVLERSDLSDWCRNYLRVSV